MPDVGVWNALDAENLHQDSDLVNLLYEAERKNYLFSLIFSEGDVMPCSLQSEN